MRDMLDAARLPRLLAEAGAIHALWLICVLATVPSLHGQARLGPPLTLPDPDSKTPDEIIKTMPRPVVGQLPTARPTADQLFRLDCEESLLETIASESRANGQTKVLFPKRADVPVTAGRAPPPLTSVSWQTAALCHPPRYFEEENVERYGIYCPLLQPLISASCFYFDTLCLPLRMTVTPPWRRDCVGVP